MTAKDLGTKFSCFKCGTKFYDMRKPAPVCPKCGSDQRDSPALKAPPPSERRRAAAAKPIEPTPEVAEEVDEAVVDEDADEDADAEDAVEEEDEP